MQLCDVVLPLPLNTVFSYSVSPSLENLHIGSRVLVQFGKKKYYTAIVVRLYEGEKQDTMKEIVSVLDQYPIVLPTQLEFWRWISSYYMCSLGDVYKAALPAALKLESETYVHRIVSFRDQEQLTATELQIYDSLSSEHSLKASEIEHRLKANNVLPHIKSLVDKGAVFVSENIHANYAPKTETRICLYKDFSEDELHAILLDLKRAKKQQSLFSSFLDMGYQQGEISTFSLSKTALLDQSNISSSVLNGLIEKEVLRAFESEISRFDYGKVNLEESNKLNTYQQEAYSQLQESFSKHSTTLLHGVTSSGKTEIYIQIIKDSIAKGKRVLYLLPEIALTTQITERLKAVFGKKLLVYHSRFNDNERAEVWNKLLLKEDVQVILGARSSVFLPFCNLDLIIVDEEHESSYKQQDPAPRYNARNAAMMLAGIHQAKVLLGTATPAIETYYNALLGKYGFVRLSKRHENIELPKILTIDTKVLRKRKQMKSVLSPPLIAEIEETLLKGKQVILFQNRRGFSPLVECKICSWTPLCEHCDVSLTYHKGQGVMACHYCGATYSIPRECPNCETPSLDTLGYGTERIEEEVRAILPQALPIRMDLDTTRSKKGYERIIHDFEDGKSNILIGTQMVSKGLDFENVSLVGILNADSSLNHPDFRAHEKAFQLMTQVSGRAGRKNKQGLVMLQTSQPGHPIIRCVIDNDYKRFYDLQIEERQLFSYPPFRRLIAIVLKGKNESQLDAASKQFAESLRESFQQRVLGPSKPVIPRIQSLYIRHILLKIENQASTKEVREAILHHQKAVFSRAEYPSILVSFDVDPLA